MTAQGVPPATPGSHDPRTATVLVTGASSGIGEALGRRFARAGHPLVLVARSADKLGALAAALRRDAGVAVAVVPADLVQPGAAARLAATLRRRRVAIDILVNNAGVLEHGAFAQITPARHRELIALNVGALTDLLGAFVPPMAARGRGRVLNVASIAAFQPVPGLAVYAASKAYVLSLTESLAEELRGSGVTATALCPGITATPMVATALEGDERLAERLPGFLVGAADAVAEVGYRACMAGDAICVPGLANRATTLAGRALPKWLLRRIAGVLGRSTL